MHVLNREHATDAERPMPHGLMTQVEEIKATEYLRTGRTLTTEEALAELDNPTPPKRSNDWKAQVRAILARNFYGNRIGERVFALIEHEGTVLGDVQLEKDVTSDVLEQIEACIPGISPWQWTGEVGGIYKDDRWAGSDMLAGLGVRSKRVGYGTWGTTRTFDVATHTKLAAVRAFAGCRKVSLGKKHGDHTAFKADGVTYAITQNGDQWVIADAEVQ